MPLPLTAHAAGQTVFRCPKCAPARAATSLDERMRIVIKTSSNRIKKRVQVTLAPRAVPSIIVSAI
eukprot:5227340-Pleurochrysis_carterae.AAC.3